MGKTSNPEELIGKVYLGKVVDNNDPDQEGRCKVIVFGVFDDLDQEKIPWANPAGRNMFAGGGGGFANISVPKVDSIVQIKFVEGELYALEYTTIQNFNSEVQAEIAGSYLNSHVIAYDVDEDMKIFYTPGKGLNLSLKGSNIIINPDSSVTVEHSGGSSIIELVGGDVNIVSASTVNVTSGSSVNVNSPSINLGEGAGQQVPRGNQMKLYNDLHFHLGPFSSPLIKLFANALSTTTKTV